MNKITPSSKPFNLNHLGKNVNIGNYHLDLAQYVANPKRAVRQVKKTVGDNNLVICGTLSSGKSAIAREFSDVYIDWYAGREPMLRFCEVGKDYCKHIALDDAHYYTPYQIAKFLELVRSHNKKFILVFLNETQLHKHLHLLKRFEFVTLNTGEKPLSAVEKKNWWYARFKPALIGG